MTWCYYLMHSVFPVSGHRKERSARDWETDFVRCHNVRQLLLSGSTCRHIHDVCHSPKALR